jgi:tetratricopeptide (TPR) repeat protein
MLERQKLIDDIRRGAAALQRYIEPSGTLNLTDTNVHAETFVAGLLNALFGWGLVGVNRNIANHPCIDLIDDAQGLAVQVTSEKGSAKLNNTIKCLKRHKCGKQIRSLKVFLLIPRQKRYTVNAKCPGIKFDWRKDVLDFDDAVKAASRIDDLHHLRGVHKYIVEAIPSVFPEYQAQSPPLNTPATDPATAWLAFSSRATYLVGRNVELGRLSEFLSAPQKFCWWLVTGAGGSGKSRLALELSRDATDWHAGFLSRTEKHFNWSRFKPSRKTLIVIDYVASRAREVSDLILTISRNSGSFENQVRVLLLERNKETWWSDFSRDESQTEAAEISARQYDAPLALAELPPGAIIQLATEVVRARNGKWDVATAAKYFLLLVRLDPACRPLFAMILAQELETLQSAESVSNLLRKVLTRESGRRRQLIQSAEDLQRIENLLLLATFVGTFLPRSNGFNFIRTSDVADLLPNMNFLNEDLYNDIAWSARGGSFLPGLQPDILGERFILDRLSAGGLSASQAHRLLRAAWTFQPEDVRVVALRLASDFPGDEGLSYLYHLPLDTSEARAEWVTMIAHLIVVTRGKDQFIKQQLKRATSLADQFPHEQRLQEAAALADYHMGCNMQFRHYEDDAKEGGAAKRFDDVVARVGSDSVIGISAVLNRGCVYESEGEKDKAIRAFMTVIASQKASDETRACAFNNRANIYADRGDHRNAIRDRTEVLALKATSPDRRFVALFRRGESYCALKRYRAALDDLSKILETDDIGPHDKLRARLERAAILAQYADRPVEARADLCKILREAMALPKDLCDHIRSLIADKGHNTDRTRKTWRELSNMVRRSANRVRITPLRIDEDAT